MAELPSGTVTFLFTDIEGSTRLLKQLRERYGEVLAEHGAILRDAFEQHGGEIVDTQGDAFFAVFGRAHAAMVAAVAGQRALAAHTWPDGVELRVRMGLHSGEPSLSESRYVGLGIHRASRIMAAGHGGQVLLSNTTRELVEDDLPDGVELRDLGTHRLKDIDRPEHLFQLEIEGLPDGFPPLRTASETAFAGREEELAEAAQAAVERPPALRRRSLLLAALAGVIAAAIAIPIFALGGGGGGSVGGPVDASIAADSVGVFDAASGKLIAQAQVPAGPSAVAVGEGSIWVANVDDDSISRIDPVTNASVQTIRVGRGPDGVAVGGGFVWVANGIDGTVSKIDPRTNGVVQTVEVGNGPAGVAFGLGSVWVANSTDRAVTRIESRSGDAHGAISAGAGADGIAVGAGAVWVTSESAGSVARIDPRRGIVTHTINVGRGARAVAVGRGAVWVANSLGGTVSRIDPASSDVQATIPVDAGPSGVAVAPDGKFVWVSNDLAGTLSRVDAAKDTVVQTVSTGNRPQSIAITGNTIYVAVRTSGLAHRGGTLTVLATDPFDSIDPAAAYSSSWQVLMLTNDGLVTYKRVGGRDGTRLVPDLATAIPTPTDGGKTYTFEVRRGIHYSDGRRVEPADFRRAIERSVANAARGAGTGFYFSSIVGYHACLKAPNRCDLSRGIATDSASNTVTFHLAAPDPDFLLKLALPAGVAVPDSTPLKARLPLPATGPYVIASYDAKRGVRLARNPRFHEWYRAAQPDGYPDEIRWRFGVLPSAQRLAVARGKADVALNAGNADHGLFPPATLFSDLRSRYASQLHVNPQLQTWFVFLNTRLPPFNDVRVRQALNFAVDRNRMVELRGGPELVQPTCQVLPPNLAGYRRYCPYTIDPSRDGRYNGPDVAKARRLVAASGTRGQDVTVAGISGTFQPHGGDYLVSVLRSLGYRAHFKNFKDLHTYFGAAADSRRRIQAGIGGWVEDYPSAGNFLVPLLTCGSFVPRSSENFNLAEFCNRRIDAEIARARSLEITDPGAASRLWTKIDRDVVQQAPWLFLGNALWVDFVSRRVGNYQYDPQLAVLDQLWVR